MFPIYRAQRLITSADLTDSTNGEAQKINVGEPLPSNAVVIAHAYDIQEAFTGGGATAVTLDIFGERSTGKIARDADVLGSLLGEYTNLTGNHMQGHYGGDQLQASFTPDSGHNLAALTTGIVLVSVWWIDIDFERE